MFLRNAIGGSGVPWIKQIRMHGRRRTVRRWSIEAARRERQYRHDLFATHIEPFRDLLDRLRVIYVPDPEPDSVFVITAYELSGGTAILAGRAHVA